MNAREVADQLGFNERSVRRAVQEGRLPAGRNGRELDIDLDEAIRVMNPRASSKANMSRVEWLEVENERLWRLLEIALGSRASEREDTPTHGSSD